MMPKTTLQNFFDRYPRIKLLTHQNQNDIFSIVEQSALSTESLQISFDRRPDFFSFLKAQGENPLVFGFYSKLKDKNDSCQGFGVFTFRQMQFENKSFCLGYTSDLRTTPLLDREARLQWRAMYGEVIGQGAALKEFQDVQGFVTAVWDENKLAQAALVKTRTKQRPNDIVYQRANQYRSFSIWGRSKLFLQTQENIRPVRSDEIGLIKSKLCQQNDLCWNEQDLLRTLSVFGKSFSDFYVLERKGQVAAFILPCKTSPARKTVVKKWPWTLAMVAKLMPLLGRRQMKLNEPLAILQLLLMRSLVSDADECLIQFIDYFWQQNQKLSTTSRLADKFSILSVHRWDPVDQKNSDKFDLKKRGYLSTEISGALYKVLPPKSSPDHEIPSAFEQIQDFSALEIGFL